MKTKTRVVVLLLAIIIAITATGTVSAEWHKTNTYIFDGDVGQIGLSVADGNGLSIEFNNSNSDLVKIGAWSGDREVLGIDKKTECHRTLYQTSPYRAFPVGKQRNTWQETIAVETLVQFYWVNHKGPSWWKFDTSVMDKTAAMWNYAVRYRVTTGNSSISIEEWRNY